MSYTLAVRIAVVAFLSAPLAIQNAHAQLAPVNTRAELGGSVLDWHAIYCPGGVACTDDVPNSSTATGLPGLNIRTDGAAPTVSTQGAGIGGEFILGEPILIGGAASPLQLRFDADLFGFGANMTSTAFGDFRVRVTAYDALDALLGFHEVTGLFDVGDVGTGSHPFAGFLSVSPVRRIDVSAWQLFADGSTVARPIAMNQATITRDPVNAVPEPGTYWLLGAGLLGIGVVGRRSAVLLS